MVTPLSNTHKYHNSQFNIQHPEGAIRNGNQVEPMFNATEKFKMVRTTIQSTYRGVENPQTLRVERQQNANVVLQAKYLKTVFGDKTIQELVNEFEGTCEICAKDLSNSDKKVHKCSQGVGVCASCLEKVFLIQAHQ